jgi:hypothetical protein
MKKYVVLALLFSGIMANSYNSHDFIVVGDRTSGCVTSILEFE